MPKLDLLCATIWEINEGIGGGGEGENDPFPLRLTCYKKLLGRPRVNMIVIVNNSATEQAKHNKEPTVGKFDDFRGQFKQGEWCSET